MTDLIVEKIEKNISSFLPNDLVFVEKLGRLVEKKDFNGLKDVFRIPFSKMLQDKNAYFSQQEINVLIEDSEKVLGHFVKDYLRIL